MTTTQPEATHHDHEHDDANLDRGLAFDVDTLVTRRRALQLFGMGAGIAVLAGCGAASVSSTASTSSTSTTAPAAAASDATVTEIPQETAGPYPGDGSNGPNVLDDSGIVRSDIRSSFGDASGTAEGVGLTINLDLVNMDASNAAYEGAAVYLWHCNRDGEYSLYSSAIESENYLRGVQVADALGRVTFTSIFPAAYSGRWPHIHFEVYSSVADATSGADPIATSQVALPQATCGSVYATDGYSASVSNMKQTALDDDNVFGDDSGAHQLATVTGSVAEGFIATLQVPVAASTEAVSSAAPAGGGMGGGGRGGTPPSR